MEKKITTPRSHRWKIFCVVAIGVFMSTMDSSMVNIALPSIMSEFQSPLQATEWVVLIYLLTITSSLLLWGHLSDRIGRKKIYSYGLLLFAAASMSCAGSPTLILLAISRFFQAIGAAMMMSTGPAIIKDNFPAGQLGRSLGMIGIAVSCGLMVGPALGGFLLEYFSWRAIFLITVPIGILFSIIAWRMIPSPTHTEKHKAFNWPSSICWVALLSIASIAITYASSPKWSGSILGSILFLLSITLIAFIILERRGQIPFLPPHLISQRYFYTATLCAVLSFTVLFSVLIIMPFYLDRVMGVTKATIGLIMMSLPVAVLIVAPTAGWLSDHLPSKFLSTAGLAISTITLFLLSDINETTPLSNIVLKLILLGCGQGMFLSPNSASVLHRVPKTDTGKAAAILATARNLGMLLGIGHSTLVFSFFFSQLTGGLDMKDYTPQHSEAFVTALTRCFQTAACIGIIGTVTSWLRDGKKTST